MCRRVVSIPLRISIQLSYNAKTDVFQPVYTTVNHWCCGKNVAYPQLNGRLLLLPICIQVIRYNNKTILSRRRWPQTPIAPASKAQARKWTNQTIDHAASNVCNRLPGALLVRLASTDTDMNTNRMWKSRWISTGADVQNPLFFGKPDFYPRSVTSRRKVCQPGKMERKSLILWSKQRLSTVQWTFTITTNFVYILFK